MNKNILEWFKPYVTTCIKLILGLFVVFVFFWFFALLHAIWQQYLTKEIDYSRIDSVVGVMGVPISALTILFVAITYRQQAKQIKEAKNEARYNKLKDLVYNQLGFSKMKLIEKIGDSNIHMPSGDLNMLKKVLALVNSGLDEDEERNIEFEEAVLDANIEILMMLQYLHQDLELSVLEIDNADIEDQQKKTLMKIINTNLLSSHIGMYELLSIKMFKFFTEEYVNKYIHANIHRFTNRVKEGLQKDLKQEFRDIIKECKRILEAIEDLIKIMQKYDDGIGKHNLNIKRAYVYYLPS